MGNGLISLLRRLEDMSSHLQRGVLLCMFSRDFLLAKLSRLLVPSISTRYSLLAKFNSLLPLHIYSTTPSIPRIHLAVERNALRFYNLSGLYHILHTNLTLTKPLHKLPTRLVSWAATLWVLLCWSLSCGYYGGCRMLEYVGERYMLVLRN